MKRITLSVSTAILCVLFAGAWGQKGHDTTAFIAEQHLTAATRDSVLNLLDGKSPVYWSNWLDNASHTPAYAYTKTWHYKNIDKGVPYEKAAKNTNGDVVTAIHQQIEILKDRTQSREKRQLALKILVHLLGDLHQPMHLGHASDLGGNHVDVKYFQRKTNLHSVWDSSLPESAHKWSYSEWQNQLDRLSETEEAEIISGSIDDWARQTFDICTEVYEETPSNTVISYDYIANWTPVIEQQFMRGGLRLAYILNEIFDPASND